MIQTCIVQRWYKRAIIGWGWVMNDTILQITIEIYGRREIAITCMTPPAMSNTQRPTPSAMSISRILRPILSRREVCRMNKPPRNQYKDQRYSNSPRFQYAWQWCTSDTNVGDWRKSYLLRTCWAVTVAVNLLVVVLLSSSSSISVLRAWELIIPWHRYYHRFFSKKLSTSIVLVLLYSTAPR